MRTLRSAPPILARTAVRDRLFPDSRGYSRPARGCRCRKRDRGPCGFAIVGVIGVGARRSGLGEPAGGLLRRRSGGVVVSVDESTEDSLPADPVDRARFRRFLIDAGGGVLVDAAVGAVAVVVLEVLDEQHSELAFVPDQGAVDGAQVNLPRVARAQLGNSGERRHGRGYGQRPRKARMEGPIEFPAPTPNRPSSHATWGAFRALGDAGALLDAVHFSGALLAVADRGRSWTACIARDLDHAPASTLRRTYTSSDERAGTSRGTRPDGEAALGRSVRYAMSGHRSGACASARRQTSGHRLLSRGVADRGKQRGEVLWPIAGDHVVGADLVVAPAIRRIRVIGGIPESCATRRLA